MPSFKSRLVTFYLRHRNRKAFASPENLHDWIAWSRRNQNHRPPQRIARRLTVEESAVDGFPVYEVIPENPGPFRILYLHGGAYVFEITPFHWAMIAEMAERLSARVTVPIYPIAPEHDFHEMFAMVAETYRGMLDETPADDIVFMGDSAGGNMAVVLTMMAAEDGVPAPGAHVLISPGLDMSLKNPAIFEAERQDPWLAIPGGLEAVRLYAGEIGRDDWRISPIYGDLSVLPRTLLLTGSRDLLTPDNLIFAEKARQAGVEVELVLEPGMFHVWPLIDMPEARRARDRIVSFLAVTPAPSRTAPAPGAAAFTASPSP